MIFFDATQPNNKNKIFFCSNENKSGMIFIDCNLKAIVSGFSELIDTMMEYAQTTKIINKDLLENMIVVFSRIADTIKLTKKNWKSFNKISIGITCTFVSKNKIVYNIIAPHFFPIEKIEQII